MCDELIDTYDNRRGNVILFQPKKKGTKPWESSKGSLALFGY